MTIRDVTEGFEDRGIKVVQVDTVNEHSLIKNVGKAIVVAVALAGLSIGSAAAIGNNNIQKQNDKANAKLTAQLKTLQKSEDANAKVIASLSKDLTAEKKANLDDKNHTNQVIANQQNQINELSK